jgi:hypothetical protein
MRLPTKMRIPQCVQGKTLALIIDAKLKRERESGACEAIVVIAPSWRTRCNRFGGVPNFRAVEGGISCVPRNRKLMHRPLAASRYSQERKPSKTANGPASQFPYEAPAQAPTSTGSPAGSLAGTSMARFASTRPLLCSTASRISSARSGLATRNCLAFSRPWPSRVDL